MKQVELFCLTLFICVALQAQTSTDTAAIKQLLEKESATWRSGDIPGHANCWHIQSYSKILVSTADGKCYDVSPETMIHPPAATFGKGGSSSNSNYKFCIHGNDAWVSHDESSTAAGGTVTYSHEIRILEKINNEWKLVAQSIHLCKP